MPTLLPVALASLLAGAANSIAGGGTLLTFPALIGLGIPPITANATSTVALVPGSFSSMMGYRESLRNSKSWLYGLALPGVFGGALGAWLLVITPAKRFSTIIPYLVLGATVLFLAQRPLLAAIGKGHANAPEPSAPSAGLIAAQFAIAIYGGYFGAAAGIVMLAGLGLMGLRDIHQMNGLKNWAAVCFNGVAAGMFIFSGLVDWPVAVVMAISAATGGWTAARLAQRVPRERVRQLVGIIGLSAATWLFLR